VCITVAGQANYSQCYNVVVTEPQDLSVYSTINSDNSLTLALTGGNQYNIQLNGVSYTTANSSITLPLVQGNNSLTITTDRLCQGTFQKVINGSGNITPYPVPFQNTLNINLGNANINNASIEIHNLSDGRVVYTKQYINQSGVLQLDVSNLDNGVYLLHLIIDNSDKIFKIIKK
jgi:Secretion system C-terminal sorting domain